jgi:coproporphyrinogen III oxidase-like Fe-S oxidoreductase
MAMTLAQELLDFHSPGNRFAYYPQTKGWNNERLEDLEETLLNLPSELQKIGHGHLYIHIPYCKSLCTFCGCNIKIDQNKEEHLTYIAALIKELELKDPKGLTRESIKALTFGGGSPNTLHPAALEKLILFLKGYFESLEEILVEVDPLTLSNEQVGLFNQLTRSPENLRFSMGVQDFSNEVCENVNRHQESQHIEKAFHLLKDHDKGIDLIWGLPHQTRPHIDKWQSHLKKLAPDWINFYPLAKVPWLAPYQDAYGSFKLPSLKKKYELFEAGHNLIEELHYHHFAFGHYLKEGSNVAKALKDQCLFRSVSGIYQRPHLYSLGLGVGAISSFEGQLHQNDRILDKYKYSILEKKDVSGERAHRLSGKEIHFNSVIDEALYRNQINVESLPQLPNDFNFEGPGGTKGEIWKSHWFREDLSNAQALEISPKGRLFLKNILQNLEKLHFD